MRLEKSLQSEIKVIVAAKGCRELPYTAKKSEFLWKCRNKMGFTRVSQLAQSVSPETGHESCPH